MRRTLNLPAVIAVCAGTVATACGGGATAEPPSRASATNSATNSATPTLATYATVPHSKDQAQRLLDRAAVAPGQPSAGSFELSYVTAGARFRTSGRYVYTSTSSRIDSTSLTPTGTTRARLIGRDGWLAVARTGRRPRCWLHTARDVPEPASLTGGIASPLALMVAPRARGLLSGGTSHQVVMQLDSELALSVVAPRVAHLLGTAAGSTVPAVATLTGGRFATIVFHPADAVDSIDPDKLSSYLIKEGISTATTPDQIFSDDVTVAYRIGGDIEPISAPPASDVVELADTEDGTDPCA